MTLLDFMFAQHTSRTREQTPFLGLLKAIFSVYALYTILSCVIFPAPANAQYMPEPGSPLVVPTGNPKYDPSKQYYEPPKCKSGKGDPLSRTYLPVADRGHSDPQNTGSYCLHLGKTAEARDQAKNAGTEPPCAETYADWLDNPHLDFWVEDPEVTSLGKGGERSREFLLWALTRQSIDDHPVILDTWKLSQNIALFLILIIVIIMGIGIIVGQQGIGFMGSSFSYSVELTPLIMRIAALLLFVIFSARIVLIFIQLSDVMMEFFIRTLGVRDLFNIYFNEASGAAKDMTQQLVTSEKAYKEFLGCTNWNINNQEMVTTSKALIRFTNMTYYFIGGMLILRKVVLWFLLMVAPFLAILAPFVFIRNTGWIWIGVFFQWIFYGPLMALFLGGLANIWNSKSVHIPYIFDFSRTNDMAQVVYPTSINILYGGPAQQLKIFNTSNYVDTFAEYIISLIMLWTVLILPWWLLRIFRDYCCDGIYSMKNILMSMYDQMRTNPGGPNGPTPTPAPTGTTSTARELPTNIKQPADMKIKLETVQDIKQAQTQQIVRSISMEASSIKDVARMETNDVTRQQVTQNLNQLQNPFNAETPTERQRIMNLRNEVQQRAQKGDVLAQRIAAVTKSAVHENISKEKILSSMPSVVIPAGKITVNVTVERQQNIVQSAMNYASRNQQIVENVANQSHVSNQQVSSILQTYNRVSGLNTSVESQIGQIAQEVGLQEQQVKQVISQASLIMRSRTDIMEAVARQESVDTQTVDQAVQDQLQEAVGVTDEKSTNIVKRVFTQVSTDANAVRMIAQQAHITEEQAQNVLKGLGTNERMSVSVKDAVAETAVQTGLQPEQVRQVATQAAYVVKSNTMIVQPIAQEEQMEQATVQEAVEEKIAAVGKDTKEIEDFIPQTQKVSIEDYEEVKEMWVHHYDSGEIPETENISTREEWVEQDVVRISNILNKLLSANKQLQEQGLTEVGYILPIFMVNNLTGEELLVYLKAKIQAAKEVSKQIRREKEIMKKAKGEEEFVDIERPKEAVAAKTQTLTNELEIENGEEVKQSSGEEVKQSRSEEEMKPFEDQDVKTPQYSPQNDLNENAPDVDNSLSSSPVNEFTSSPKLDNIKRTLEDEMKS